MIAAEGFLKPAAAAARDQRSSNTIRSRSQLARGARDYGQIVEENLMYDLVTFMKQIGLGD